MTHKGMSQKKTKTNTLKMTMDTIRWYFHDWIKVSFFSSCLEDTNLNRALHCNQMIIHVESEEIQETCMHIYIYLRKTGHWRWKLMITKTVGLKNSRHAWMNEWNKKRKEEKRKKKNNVQSTCWCRLKKKREKKRKNILMTMKSVGIGWCQ